MRASSLVGVMASSVGIVVLGAGVVSAQSASSATPMEVAVACGAPVLSDNANADHAYHVIGAQDTNARTN